MSKGTPREEVRYWFGDFELSTEPYYLARHGEKVELAPQPAKLLELLLASAGDVVTREAIRKRLWDEDTFVDHVRGINFVVHQIRAALADHASAPKYIETVPRQGYRFMAPVSTAHPPAVDDRKFRWAKILPRVALALLVAAVVFSLFRWNRRAHDAPRMAVLAATDVGSNSAQPVSFATEMLIAHLAEVFGSHLDVVAPPPGVETTKESVMAEASYVLSLAYVDGTAAPTLVVRLSRCGDHTTLWTTRASASRRALPDVLSRVVKGVADSLGIAPQSSVSFLESVPRDALVYYFEGQYSLERYEALRERAWPDEAILRTARAQLEHALALAPELDRAQVALARVKLRQRQVDAARSAALAVLDANPASIEAHLVMAEIALYFERDFDTGLDRTATALALNPRDPAALMLRALVLSASGRHQEALAAAQRAVDTDLSSPKYYLGLAHVAMNAGYYRAAITAAEHVLAFEPAHCAAWRCRIESLLLSGDEAAALRDINSFLANWEPNPGPATSVRAYRELDLAHRRWSDDGVIDLPQRALVHIGLGEVEKGLALLLEACEKGVGGELAFLAVNPRFSALRLLPEYAQLESCVSPDKYKY